ncbi:MAG: TetR/AcrR family transcriptional regulator C-terminal domain-containing protein [Fusicatenibacter sp.]
MADRMTEYNGTKNLLAAAMKKLMKKKSFEKISISDICEECGMNRKSFYYHFKDKYDLVNWIFYVDFLENVSVTSFENEWDLLVAICNLFYNERDFYKSALKIEGQNSFRDFLYEMLTPFVAYFVRDLFNTQNQEFFVTFFCDAFLVAILRWFSMKNEPEPEEFVRQLQEVLWTAADRVVENRKNSMEK